MRTWSRFNALFLLLVCGAATAAEAQVDPQLARRYFDEAKKLYDRDAGRLCGVSLWGPLVIFDPATGTRATSHPEPPGPRPWVSCHYCDPDGLGTADRWREWEHKYAAPDLAPYISLLEAGADHDE